MNRLLAGFGRVNITPMMGIFIEGYFKTRHADGVLDELEANALAFSDGEKRALLLTVDNCGGSFRVMSRLRAAISEKTGGPAEAVFIHSTHTHTGPSLAIENFEGADEARLIGEYIDFLEGRLCEAAKAALDDLKPAKMGYGVGHAPNIAFVRRFRMKDGSIKTNPGVNNPDILHPIGDVDERVNVLRFEQEGGQNLVLINFGCHPDVVGGCSISGDWPAFTRRILERAIDGTRAVFCNGVEGDVNHVNVHPGPGDYNGMFNDFDDVSRGYAHSRHMGNVVAAAVMQVYEKVAWTDVDAIRFAQKTIDVPSNVPDPKDMPEARRIHEMHISGRDDELPYKGMMLTTVVAEAGRMIRLEHGPESFPLNIGGLVIGSVALCGIAGEPFTGIGRGIKEAEGWELVLPCCLTNGSEGYFPMREAYEEGGYEARSSSFKAGIAELIIEEGKKVLKEMEQ